MTRNEGDEEMTRAAALTGAVCEAMKLEVEDA